MEYQIKVNGTWVDATQTEYDAVTVAAQKRIKPVTALLRSFAPFSSQKVTVNDPNGVPQTSTFFNDTAVKVDIKESDFFVPMIGTEPAKFVDCKDTRIERIAKSIVNVGLHFSYLTKGKNMDTDLAVGVSQTTESDRTAKWRK